MPHKFFKIASSGEPSRVSDTLWDRLKKVAHHVWQIDSENGEPVITRIKGETVTAVKEPEDTFTPGDLVLLFMGGQQLEGRVASVRESDLVLEINNELFEVPAGWVKSIK